MTKTIHRIPHHVNYTVIDNSIFKTLTPEAIGVLVFMLSHPDDWRFSNEYLKKSLGMGKTKTSRVCAELKDKGYLNQTQEYEGGQIAGLRWDIYETGDDYYN